jgi:hypothetical protein
MGVLSLCAASLTWGGSGSSATAGSPAALPGKAAISAPVKAAKSKPMQSASNGNLLASGSLQGTLAPQAAPAPSAPKPALADAFIAQTVLRVYLNRPAAIFVYNSRGQQVYHLDSQRAMEAVPLQGMSTGFVYLTVRTAQGEMTRKLVFTGK